MRNSGVMEDFMHHGKGLLYSTHDKSSVDSQKPARILQW